MNYRHVVETCPIHGEVELPEDAIGVSTSRQNVHRVEDDVHTTRLRIDYFVPADSDNDGEVAA